MDYMLDSPYPAHPLPNTTRCPLTQPNTQIPTHLYTQSHTHTTTSTKTCRPAADLSRHNKGEWLIIPVNNWETREGNEWNTDSTIKPSTRYEFIYGLKNMEKPTAKAHLHIFLNYICICVCAFCSWWWSEPSLSTCPLKVLTLIYINQILI